MRIISVIGPQNAGKTTLLVALAAELVRRGHRVMTIKHGSLASARLGEELDAVATYPYSANLVTACGVAWVVDGPALRSLNRLQGDLTWVYVTFAVKF